jgi:hypothetical protein
VQQGNDLGDSEKGAGAGDSYAELFGSEKNREKMAAYDAKKEAAEEKKRKKKEEKEEEEEEEEEDELQPKAEWLNRKFYNKWHQKVPFPEHQVENEWNQSQCGR